MYSNGIVLPAYLLKSHFCACYYSCNLQLQFNITNLIWRNDNFYSRLMQYDTIWCMHVRLGKHENFGTLQTAGHWHLWSTTQYIILNVTTNEPYSPCCVLVYRDELTTKLHTDTMSSRVVRLPRLFKVFSITLLVFNKVAVKRGACCGSFTDAVYFVLLSLLWVWHLTVLTIKACHRYKISRHVGYTP